MMSTEYFGPSVWTSGTLSISGKIFVWKFWKLSVSNGRHFFHSFQTCNLLDRSKKRTWWHNDGARRSQNGSGNFVWWNTIGGWNEKVKYFCCSCIIFGKCSFDPRLPCTFQLVKPKILAWWKGPLIIQPLCNNVEWCSIHQRVTILNLVAIGHHVAGKVVFRNGW